jgi:hypothetical protein
LRKVFSTSKESILFLLVLYAPFYVIQDMSNFWRTKGLGKTGIFPLDLE